MINVLNDAIELGKANEAQEKVLNGLVLYTEKHFAYEERLFKKFGYAEQQSHFNEHTELVDQVKDLQKKMKEGDFMLSIELMLFLKDWLTKHILKTDMAYAPFLIEKGVK